MDIKTCVSKAPNSPGLARLKPLYFCRLSDSTSNSVTPRSSSGSSIGGSMEEGSSVSSKDGKIPLFLVKLWKIVDDVNLRDVVSWDAVSEQFVAAWAV